jgi:Flp pilus assembly protein TadG
MRNKNSSGHKGQALIEFALILPLLFLLVVNVVNFGGLFSAWVTVTHATRSAAQLAATGSAYLGYGAPNGMAKTATNANILKLLTDCTTVPHGDMCSLPNRPSITVTVCTNDSSGTPSFGPPGTCLSSVTDPEAATSSVATVNVSYRYCPLIPFWEFPALGIHSTLQACSPTNDSSVCPAPPTVNTSGICVHRTAAMRIIQ